jgi:hypothetical protein
MTAGWDALVLHPDDDVAVALRDLGAGTPARIRRGDAVLDLRPAEPIALGHKLALRAIAPGETLRKYGAAIGAATRPIAAGAHVHVHNLVSLRARAAT